MDPRSDQAAHPAAPSQPRLAPVDLADAGRLGQVPRRELTPATQKLIDQGPSDAHRDHDGSVSYSRFACAVALGMRSSGHPKEEWERALVGPGAPLAGELRRKPRHWWDQRWAAAGRMPAPHRPKGDPARAAAWGAHALAVVLARTPAGKAQNADARVIKALTDLACRQPPHSIRVSERGLSERCRQQRKTVRRAVARLRDLGLAEVVQPSTAECPPSYRLVGGATTAHASIGVNASDPSAGVTTAPTSRSIGVNASESAPSIGVNASEGYDPTFQPPTEGKGGLLLGVNASDLDLADAFGVTAARVLSHLDRTPGDRTGLIALATPLSERTVSAALRRLAAEGLVMRDGDGWCLSGEDLAAAAADEVAAQTVRVVTGAGGLAERHRAERDRRDRVLQLGPVGEAPEGDRWHELDEDPWADPPPAPPIGAGEHDPRPAPLRDTHPHPRPTAAAERSV